MKNEIFNHNKIKKRNIAGCLIIFYLIIAYIFGLWPFDKTNRAVANSNFNVYFSFPYQIKEDFKQYYLGRSSSLSSCGLMASSYAFKKGVHDKKWSYICCRITSNSNCASKHR